MSQSPTPFQRMLPSIRRGLVALLTTAALASCAPPSSGPLREVSQGPALGTSQAALSFTLGAQYDGTASNINFNVYSSRATRIALYLYSQPTGVQESCTFALSQNTTTHVWSATVPVSTIQGTCGITGTVYYGYRAWGPNWPYSSGWTKGTSVGFISDVDSAGNRFNPNKLLLDPYAWEMSHDPITATMTNATIYASGASYRAIDDGTSAPKGIVLPVDTSSFGTKPTRAQKDDIIYEVNVRGLTKQDPGIATAYQGTYKGAGLKASYLSSLGITAVEFLPVQETQNDANDNTPNSDVGQNYWGYNTLNYFAPDRHYSSDKTPGGPTREFKAMVAAFHSQGIKVYIDVVYNHTGEGYAWSSTDPTTYNIISFRGLDNPTYYELTSDNQSNWDNTGCGGNYNTFNPVAQQLIIDSLKYWRDVIGVDGFRFDLASVLGNTCTNGCYNYDKFNTGTALNGIWNNLTPRPAAGGSGVDLFAEPWAIGGNSYQLGGMPDGWSEWNGNFRDQLRQAQNDLGSIVVTTGTLASRFAGSSDIFQSSGRSPWSSTNFMDVHDGFTLKDLYSYNSPNNGQAWPWGPSDGGSTSNYSWDQGGSATAQRQAARTGLAFTLLSAGTPLIAGGDEFLRTIQGNNNPYNLDSPGNWLNWSWTTDQSTFQTFAQRLIAFRKAHPALRPATWYTSSQMQWWEPSGAAADSTYFGDSNNHAIAYQLDGTQFGDSYSSIYVAYNGWSGMVNFILPYPGSGKSWYRVMDTSAWNEGANTVMPPGQETFIGGQGTSYGVNGRATLLLIAK